MSGHVAAAIEPSGGFGAFGWSHNLFEQVGQTLPSQRSQHPIRDARREVIRPLVHRLVGDADTLGGGGRGPAKQFDGLSFKHGALNHSSRLSATIVLKPLAFSAAMVDWSDSTYAERLQWAMDKAGKDRKALASHLGISENAVKKLLAGTSAAMSVPNHARAAKWLNVSADWLALAEGSPERRQEAPAGSDATLPLREGEHDLLAAYRLIPQRDRDDVLSKALQIMLEKNPDVVRLMEAAGVSRRADDESVLDWWLKVQARTPRAAAPPAPSVDPRAAEKAARAALAAIKKPEPEKSLTRTHKAATQKSKRGAKQ